MAGPKVVLAKKALPRGRPRQFDKPEAVRQALNLFFWERGYEGVTTTELTRAMGHTYSRLKPVSGVRRQGGCISRGNPALRLRSLRSGHREDGDGTIILCRIGSHIRQRHRPVSERRSPGGMSVPATAESGLRPERSSLQAIVIGYRKRFLDLLVRRASEAAENGELRSDVDPQSSRQIHHGRCTGDGDERE